MKENTEPLISLVVPVYQEAENIVTFLRDLEQNVEENYEAIIVYDFPEDNTLPAIEGMSPAPRGVRLVHNTLGKGVLNALKAGLQAANGDAIIVMMADCSDRASDVPVMAERIRQGADVVAGSRYVKGGSQEGGPLLKRCLSRLAGMSLHYLTGLPVHDATNNFRAYSRDVIDHFTIESKAGFSLALELTVKAHWEGMCIEEVPTVWTDRTAGESRFNLFGWMPHYLKWYLKAIKRAWFGPHRGLRSR